MEEKLNDIVEIMEKHVESLSVKTLFTFIHGSKGYANLKADDLVLPVGWLGYPITSSDDIKKSGYIEPTYDVELFLGDKSKLDFTPEEHRVIIKRMRMFAKKIVNKLIEDEDNIRSVSNVSRTDAQNFTDVPLTGVYLKMKVTVIDNSSNCTD